MKTLVFAVATTVALAGCGSREDAAQPAETDAPSEAKLDGTATGDMTGTYEVKTGDGTVTMQTINADGTYVDMTPDGTRIGGGSWRATNDGRMCFDPEGDEVEECYAGGAPGEDGSFETRDAQGNVTSTVRKVDAQAEAEIAPTQ